MATAAELLATSDVLSIDVAKRTINIPKNLTLLGVTSDEDVQKLRFSMSRYYNGIDLSTHTIRINYENAQGEGDVYGATDIKVTDDTIEFTWVVSRHATMYEGSVKFTVCMVKTDGESNIVSEFNTIPTTLPVIQGLETDPTEDLDEYPDVIDAVAAEVLSKAKANGDFTPVKGEDYYTPEEAAEFGQMVVDNANGQFANAIKGVKSGEVIRVDDVSPIEHTVNCWVHGKNLWTTDLTYPVNNIDYDPETQIYTFSGPTNTTLYTLPVPIPKGTTCTITAKVLSGNVTSGGDGGIAFGGYYRDEQGVSSWQSYINIPKLTNGDISGETYTNTVTVTEDVTHFYAFIYAATATVHEPLQIQFQYEIGAVATEFAPPIDQSTVTLKRVGKGVFATKEYILESSTPYAWSSILMAKIKVPNGIYTASCKYKQSGSDKSTVALSMREYGNSAKTLKHVSSKSNNGELFATFEVTGDNEGFEMYLYSNYSADELSTKCLFYDIFVEVGEEATGFEPYNISTVTPATDGKCTVSSVSPTMTLFTDTPGVIVEAEYSRDTTKMFESYVLTDRAIGAITAEIEDDMVEVLEALNSYAASLTGGVS